MRRKVLRRGARHEARLAELARHQVLRSGGADAHREVEAFLDQVHHAVGERDVEAHLRVLGEEVRDRRREVAYTEVHRRSEPDRAARHHRGARGFLLRLLKVGDELHRALVERTPGFGKADPAGRAVEEPGLEVRLQLRYMPGRRRSGKPEARGRLGKAPGFNDLGEYLDSAEPIHCSVIRDYMSNLPIFIPYLFGPILTP
jgi:hypothetical protein